MKKLIALLLALVMVFSLGACAGNTDAETEKPSASKDPSSESASAEDGITPIDEMEDPDLYFTQFDEPFELHIAYQIPSDGMDSLADGDSIEDNYYTRWLLENFNIKVVFDWTASTADYDQKLSMAISSDTLPDAWLCSSQQWKAAAKNGQVLDISDYYQYVNPTVRAIYEPVYDKYYNSCSYDGELSCLTAMSIATETVSCLMINQNWLDQLNLEVPTTLDEVADVARAFKEAGLAGSATVPILGPGNDSNLYVSFNRGSSVMTLDAIFSAMGAYPGIFYEKDGELVYGSLTQETRDTLELLSQWYDEGLLDPEIGIRTTSWEPINANTCGMFFGCWWTIGFGNPSSFANDPNADWRAYPIYNDNGEWTPKVGDITNGQRFCINAEADEETALAALIAVNAPYHEKADVFNTETMEDIAWYPLRLVVAAEDFVDRAHDHAWAVLQGEEDPDLYKGDPLYNEIWLSVQYIDELMPNYTPGEEVSSKDFVFSEDNANWQPLYSWLIGDQAYATVERAEEIMPVISYMTPSMELYWDNLQSVEDSLMLSIITGDKDISAFDDFVEQWYAEGGETILEEVAAEIA